MKTREDRLNVLIPARIRWDGRWLPASVRNVSAHGMLLRLPNPPKTGAFVELEVGSATVTARAMWVAGQTCGLKSREQFDLSAFGGGRTAPTLALATPHQARVLRRAPSQLEREEHSRKLASLFQFLTLAIVATFAAVGLGMEVYQTLSAPMDKVHAALEQK